MRDLVLSVIGTDRAGLVDALARVVADHGGTWERSQMTELSGTFAGVVQLRLPPDRVDAFTAALGPLRGNGLFDLTAVAPAPTPSDDAEPPAQHFAFTLVGNDRPGIVASVSRALASRRASIVDLRTWTASAAHAGGVLFHARAEVALPPGVAADDVVAALEELADDLMVDLDLDDQHGVRG